MKLPNIPGFSYFDKIVKIVQANASLNFLEMGMCGDAGVYVITADTNSVNYQQKHFWKASFAKSWLEHTQIGSFDNCCICLFVAGDAFSCIESMQHRYSWVAVATLAVAEWKSVALSGLSENLFYMGWVKIWQSGTVAQWHSCTCLHRELLKFTVYRAREPKMTKQPNIVPS